MIVVLDRTEKSAACVRSVRDSVPLGTPVVLVYNGSRTADAREFLVALEIRGDATVIRLDRNEGPSRARNLGIERLRGIVEFVVFLDNDVEVLPGWLEAGIAAIERGADLVQPRLLRPRTLTLERGLTRWREDGFSAYPEYLEPDREESEIGSEIEVETAIVGGTGIVRMDALGALGGFDEGLHLCEDIDLSLRARALGLRLVYAPGCRLIHDHGFDVAYDTERSDPARLLRSHVRFWAKHRLAVLSPPYVDWYLWLHRHGEPMYLGERRGGLVLVRRLRRRLAREWIFRTRPRWWGQRESAEREARRIETRLGAGGRSSVPDASGTRS